MNVLLTNATDIFAGGEDYVLILARYLALRGHRVWVSARPGHLLLKKCSDASIPTVPIPYGDMTKVVAVARLLRNAALERKIDIIHSNANYDRTCAAIACAFTGMGHVAGVHSTHSIQHNITHWLRNRFGTSHFITDADAGKGVLVKKDGIPAAKITTVPIGIEEDPQQARVRSRRRVRAAMKIAAGTPVIGNVARLVPFKGHRYLLEAAAEVVRKKKNVLFLIAGDGELQGELTAQAKALGIDRKVRFLGFRDDLRYLYPAFDVYCHSSVELASEMFPIAILRALASALPVVCTRVGGIAAMVEEGVSGHLTSPEDPHALAEGILDLLKSPNRRKSMGAASHSLFRSKYHAAVMAERVERVYKSTLKQAG
ncbi:MAG: glycosyltransferase family 4 protein [Bacteroidota bacterium]